MAGEVRRRARRDHRWTPQCRRIQAPCPTPHG
jgi:hypothetical protein